MKFDSEKMPPPVNLTDGAIEMLSNGEGQQQGLEVKPVLQVWDLRLVNTQNQNNSAKERYRLILSDGVHTQQGMLATQRNDLVRSQKLQKGSIVQLTQFMCNVIQNRMIIIILDLDVILEESEPIGKPEPYQRKTDGDAGPGTRTSPSVHPMNAPQVVGGGPESFTTAPVGIGSSPRPNLSGVNHMQPPQVDRSTVSHAYGNSYTSSSDSGRYNSTTAASMYPKTEVGIGTSRAPVNSYLRPPHPSYQQPSPMFANRGPIAKNEAPPRIIPIAALNPYQGRWTIKARVTAKGELRHYNNPRGDGKVFSFDLVDADGGEIRVTCFNAVADQFYHQIELGKVYMISKGTLKPAQRAYNHLQNDHEITLDTASIVQPCFDDDKSIPQQQFHFRSISDIEGMENNHVVDIIGIVSSISPCGTILRKNGTETQKQTLQLKDMSGRSVEITLWGNFCNAEGQTLQNMCDSGIFPVLAIKSGRVNDFNGKSVGTISTSQLFIEPDFPEAHKLKSWFDKDGKGTPSVSISREITTMPRTEVRKTISQIKDEGLGTSEKPDWITVCATLTFVKVENFCYTACPLKIGDRQCNKKVTNNGDGKWRCDRCDQTIDECDYRYILQLQIQDHSGLTWVTAFQEAGLEIMGVTAKELYFKKYEEQDDDGFADIMRAVLFSKYIFKLKVKEEIFSDEQRVKSTVVKAEKVNFSSETRYLLDLVNKLKNEDLGSLPMKTESIIPSSGLNATGFGGVKRESATNVPGYGASATSVGRDAVHANQGTSYGNQYGGSRLPSTSSTGMYSSCNSCGGMGHTSVNCPSVMSIQAQPYGSGFGNGMNSGGNAGGASGECFKCHQFGHWARDCPGISNAPPAYGSGNATPGRYGNLPRQRVGGF